MQNKTRQMKKKPEINKILEEEKEWQNEKVRKQYRKQRENTNCIISEKERTKISNNQKI